MARGRVARVHRHRQNLRVIVKELLSHVHNKEKGTCGRGLVTLIFSSVFRHPFALCPCPLVPSAFAHSAWPNVQRQQPILLDDGIHAFHPNLCTQVPRGRLDSAYGDLFRCRSTVHGIHKPHVDRDHRRPALRPGPRGLEIQ